MRNIPQLLRALCAKRRILIVGSAFVDVLVHVPRMPLSGEDIEGTSRQQLVGGCAYNVADAVDRMGVPFESLIPIGLGMIADRVRDAFRERGWPLREFAGLGDNGWCLSFIEPSGERTFVSMSGIEKCFQPEWLDVVAPETQDLIYLSGYQTDERNRAFIEALLERIRPDAQILFDPGPCSGRIPEDMMQALVGPRGILKINAMEARILAPAATVAESAAALSSMTGARVIVTDGAHGALVSEVGTVTRVPGFPVRVVDTVGSGDAHAGGILAGLASGFTLEESVLLGNAVASWVTGQEGAATAPSVEMLLNLHGDGAN